MTPHEYGKWTRAYHIERGTTPVWFLGHITPKGPYCFHWHQDGPEVSMRAIERTLDKWFGSSPDKHRSFYGPYETKEYKIEDLKRKKEHKQYIKVFKAAELKRQAKADKLREELSTAFLDIEIDAPGGLDEPL